MGVSLLLLTLYLCVCLVYLYTFICIKILLKKLTTTTTKTRENKTKRKYAVCWGALALFSLKSLQILAELPPLLTALVLHQKTIYISALFPNLLFLVSQCQIPFCTRKENLSADYRHSSFILLVGDCCFSAPNE